MRPIGARRKVESALLYLERRIVIAERRYFCELATAYREAWELIFEAHYGPEKRLTAPVVTIKASAGSEPRPSPRLRQYTEWRPLRRVVARVDSLLPAEGRWPAVRLASWRLECGHVTPAMPASLEPDRAFRRRCAECAAAAPERALAEAA